MAFDARYLGQAIQQSGSQIADMYFKKYQLRQDEDRQKRLMEEEDKYRRGIMDKEKEAQKEILKLRSDMDKSNTEWQIKFQENIKNAFGSPDLVNDLNKAVAGRDDHEKLAGQVALQLTQKLGQFKSLDENDQKLLPMLSPGSQVALMTANGAITKQLEDDQIRREQLDATMELYGLRKDSSTRATNTAHNTELGRRATRIRTFGEDIKKATEDLQNITQEKEYKQAQMLIAEALKKKGVTPEEAEAKLPPTLAGYWQATNKKKADLEKIVQEKSAGLKAEQDAMYDWVVENDVRNAVVTIDGLPYIYRGKGPDGKPRFDQAYSIGNDQE